MSDRGLRADVSACVLLALGWLCAPASAHASPAAEVPPGQVRFRELGADHGLRNLVVASVAQDDRGLLWVATEDGVYRFDGERFTQFSTKDGLLSSLVHVIGVGVDGNVCAGSAAGLACWDGERFAPTRGLPAGAAVRTMTRFAGKLWVGTDPAGLYVSGPGGKFVSAPGWYGARGTPVRALWSDAAGLVVGDGATVQLSVGDGVWRQVGVLGPSKEQVTGVLREADGTLWIRTQGHLWVWPRGAAQAEDLHDGLPPGYGSAATPSAMAIGPRGNVLVGTDAGLAYRENGRWRVIDRAAGLPKSTVSTLFVDREGSTWIGSAGLYQLRGRGLIERHDAANGLSGDVVWAFRRDAEGTLWAGTSHCLARASSTGWTCMPGTEGRVVRAVVFPPQGGVFIGGAPSDVLYIDRAGHAQSLGTFARADHNILALTLGPEGDLWIGTKSGLYRLPGAVPGPIERVIVPGAAPDARFASFAVVGNQLWTGLMPGGVAVLDYRDGRGVWRSFDRTAGLHPASINYVMGRADGRICTSYSEALGLTCFRYDGRALHDVEHITTTQGLSTGMVYFLGEDRQHRLWVGTGNGVDILTSGGVDHFAHSDGLAGNDSAAMAFLLDGDGSLWLGASGGASHVFAQSYAGPPAPPLTTLIAGHLGEHPIAALTTTSGAREIPRERAGLHVEFLAGSLLDVKRLEYQVQLSPIERAWSTTTQRIARYPVLPPGTYQFEVRARIGAGPWGPASRIDFAVLPGWWQTRWFIAIALIAGVGVLAAAFASRQRILLRRRTRQLVEESDANVRAVVDLMPDLISIYRDRQVLYLNLAHRRFIGLAPDDSSWRTMNLIERVHPEDRAEVTELFRKVRELESPVAEVIELRMRGADDTWRTCEVSGVRVEFAGAVTVVASGRDVTERRRIRAKLLVSERMASLGTLAAGIAHEINNPLAYVAGNLEVMAETLEAPGVPVEAHRAELAASIRDARDGAERVRKIVAGLRSFSRYEAERRVPLALPDVLEAAIRLTANEVRHRAQLVRELGETPRVFGDDGKLTQVFINLLVNAAHAIPEARSERNRITVRTHTDASGRAVVEIEDTGGGIPADVLSRVFDPFFTTKEVGEGTGLGLSICHGIVSGLGGHIALESVVGHGTIARVVLPASPAEPAPQDPVPAPVEVSAPARPHRHRVMLVDDEPQVAQATERILRRDYDVTVALCGEDAIAHIARGTRFDAIVSDVMMPTMTGMELLEELRRIAPDQAARLIFLSGGAFIAATRERLAELGTPQLEKPVTAKELRSWITRIITGEQTSSLSS